MKILNMRSIFSIGKKIKPQTPIKKSLSLGTLNVGDIVEIVGNAGNKAHSFQVRFRELGFAPGTSTRVMVKAGEGPKGSSVFSIGSCRFAVRNEFADLLTCKKIGEHKEPKKSSTVILNEALIACRGLIKEGVAHEIKSLKEFIAETNTPLKLLGSLKSLFKGLLQAEE